MKYFCLFLLIVKMNLLSKNYKFPRNNYFDIFISEYSFFNGSQLLLLLDLNVSYFSIKNNLIFDFKEKTLNFIGNDSINQMKNICRNDDVDKINCISGKFYIAYGEMIFVRYELLSYYLLLFGFFVTLYGYGHYIFGLIIHSSIFIYFLIKDLVELFSTFNNEKIPLLLFFASFLSGICIAFSYNISDLEKKTKNNILKILYGSFFGFFLFKTIFYYIIVFSPLNTTIYTIFLFIFLFFGIQCGVIIEYFPILDKYFFIPCSILPGSFYIIKGLSYIVGGYYSEILTTKKKLKYNNNNKELERDGNYKEKITLYIFIQFFTIIASGFYQIFYSKYLYIDEMPVQEKNISGISSSHESLLTNDINKDISRIGTKGMDTSKDITNINNNSSSNNSGTIGDVSNDIYDQED